MPLAPNLTQRSRRRSRLLALAGALAWVACVLLLQQLGYWRAFEARLQDQLVEKRDPPSDIVIVGIDDASIAAIGRWPWPRSVHAEMIDTLKEAGASTIGYDVTFSEPSNEADDAALEAALRRAGNVVLPDERVTETYVKPLPRFADAVDGRVGQTTLHPDSDGVVRSPYFFESFAELVAGRPALYDEAFRVAYYGGPGTFPSASFIDVREGRVPPETFQGKIVLVGATAPDLHDAALTPFGNGRLMHGVEIQANYVGIIRSGDPHRILFHLPLPLAAALYVGVALFMTALLAPVRLRYGVLIAFGCVLAYMLVALLLSSRGWLLPVWYALLVIIGTAVVELCVRYVSERGERRRMRDAFGRYLAPQVIRRIETGEVPLALGGERREATILFSDIRGFTTLSERLSPEELVALLNEYLTAMTTVILDHEGVVDKYIGDAIMAFWNAPAAQEDHAVRAARTALGMRDRLETLRASWKERALPDVRVGIGLNCGDVVIGNMGSEQRFDYTAIGDEVNLSSRLESLTKYYGVTILISEAVRRKLGEDFFCRRLDLVTVKGKEKPVAVYELMGETARVDDKTRELAARFDAALVSYVARRWDEAEAAFQDLSERFDDHASRLYVERCRVFRAEPPAPDWDGRFIAKEK
ncbi:MAG: adenylate/guanylate cyclase domain-containing protein [Patescibacteria group bacterium]|nr:MAG: adenylate/guanylate cyclase domain-containing protein [Patescibacteria group bacterium]